MNEKRSIQRAAILGPVTPRAGSRTVGGVAVHTEGLAAALSEHGIEPAVLADGLDGSPGEVRHDERWGDTYPVKGMPAATLAGAALTRPLAASGIAWRAATDDARSALGIPLSRALSRGLLVREALSRAAPDVLHIQQAEYRPAFVRWAGADVPTVIAVHSARPPESGGAALDDHAAAHLRAADAIVAPSRSIADRIEALGVDGTRISTVPNAVDSELFRPLERRECRKRFELNPDVPLAVFVGRATEAKGAVDLLAAWPKVASRVPAARLVFVGPWEIDGVEPPPRPADDPEASVLLDDRADRADVAAWLCAAEVVVVPSHHEGFGLTALEAMACARPLVTTRVGGLAEIVPEAAGLSAVATDPDTLVGPLATLLADTALGERLGAAGRVAAGAFTWDRTATGYAEVYALAAESHGRF